MEISAVFLKIDGMADGKKLMKYKDKKCRKRHFSNLQKGNRRIGEKILRCGLLCSFSCHVVSEEYSGVKEFTIQ